MSADNFNSLGGFSVGIPPVQVADANGNIVTNVFTPGNVAATTFYANTYRYANGQLFVSPAGGSNTQMQFNNGNSLGGIATVTWNGNTLNLGNVANVSIGGGNSGYYLQTDGAGNLVWTVGTGGGGNGSPGGSNLQVQYNNTGSFAGTSGFTFDPGSSTLAVPGPITGTAIAVSAATVYGNVNTVNVAASGNITASNYFGNGSALTGISTDTANYVIQPVQANITGVGTLSNLLVSGNIATASFVSAGNIVTSGDANVGNIKVSTTANLLGSLRVVGNITASSSPNVTFGPIANLHIAGGLNGYVMTTDGLGNLSWQAGGGGGNGTPGGSNTQVQFNDNGNFGGSPYFTVDNYTHEVQVGGTLVANSFQMGAGVYEWSSSRVYFATTTSTTPDQLLYSIPSANISGVDFHIISTDSTGSTRQSTKISSVIYNSQVQFTEYAGLYINGGTGTFSVDYNGGNIITPPSLQLTVTPDSAASTVYKMLITEFAA